MLMIILTKTLLHRACSLDAALGIGFEFLVGTHAFGIHYATF